MAQVTDTPKEGVGTPRRNAGEGNVRQRANGRWEARYIAADGSRHSLYARTKRKVTDGLRDALRDADLGVRPANLQLTTKAYLEDWLDKHARPKVRPSTLASYQIVVAQYIIPAIGRIPLAKLEPEDVQGMLAALRQRQSRRGLPMSPTTVRYAYAVLRIALGRAMKLGRVHRNVATLIDPPSKVQTERAPLTAEQVTTLVASIRSERIGPLVLTALGTGLREGELLGLRWQDVDLDAGTLAVRHTLQRVTRTLAEPKTDRARRVVPLPRTVVDVLREQRRRQLQDRFAAGPMWRDGDYVFASPSGRPQDPRNVLRAYQSALERAGLPRQPFHHLRHAYATFQLEAGEELANVSKILGHSDLSTTADLYAHLTPTTQRRAADRMDAILAG